MENDAGRWLLCLDEQRISAPIGYVVFSHDLTACAAVLLLALCVVLAWRRRETLGRLLGIYRDLTEMITVTDPHGFHMRRCLDIVKVARRYVSYGIYIRYQSASGKTWANARSLISLQALGVRGAAADESPPVVEVRVSGFRPWHAMRDLRHVLESTPQKYLSVHELYAIAQKDGGRLVVKPPATAQSAFTERLGRAKLRLFTWVRDVLYPPADTPAETSTSAPPKPADRDPAESRGRLMPGSPALPSGQPDPDAVRKAVQPHLARLKETLLKHKPQTHGTKPR